MMTTERKLADDYEYVTLSATDLGGCPARVLLVRRRGYQDQECWFYQQAPPECFAPANLEDQAAQIEEDEQKAAMRAPKPPFDFAEALRLAELGDVDRDPNASKLAAMLREQVK